MIIEYLHLPFFFSHRSLFKLLYYPHYRFAANSCKWILKMKKDSYQCLLLIIILSLQAIECTVSGIAEGLGLTNSDRRQNDHRRAHPFLAAIFFVHPFTEYTWFSFVQWDGLWVQIIKNLILQIPLFYIYEELCLLCKKRNNATTEFYQYTYFMREATS